MERTEAWGKKSTNTEVFNVADMRISLRSFLLERMVLQGSRRGREDVLDEGAENI